MTTPAASSPSAAPAPASSGSRKLLILLAVLGGLFLLLGGCVVGCTWWVGHKTKQYADEARKNPQLAAISLAASLHPDVQVLDKDEGTGRLTLKNTRTGEVVKLDLSSYTPEKLEQVAQQLSQGKFFETPASRRESSGGTDDSQASFASGDSRAVEENAATTNAASTTADSRADSTPAEEEQVSPAKAAAMAVTLKSFPAVLPVYGRGRTVEATRANFGGSTVGTYAFLTKDSPDDVLAFYEPKLTGGGYSITSKGGGANDHGPTAFLSSTRSDPQGGLTISAESEEGARVRVVISFTLIGK